MFGRKAICGSLVAFAAVLSASQLADACTRILWNDNKLAVLAGRTMDWRNQPSRFSKPCREA
jgi:penicillin V acylase-like amidase (Ntn superfamily)